MPQTAQAIQPQRHQVSYAAGFTDLDREVAIDRLPIRGKWPEWLSGTLLRVAPCKYDLERQTVSHWFDGLAMLHKFSFTDGQVSYANRFLHSDAFHSAQRTGYLTLGGFATDPCASIFQRVMSKLSSERPDNCNVSINAFAHRMIALTETRLPICFDPETLATLGHFGVSDDIGGTISTAHPHHDTRRKCQFSYVVEFGRTSRYRLFTVDDESGAQRVIAEQAVDKPAYMHSIGMSARYLVIAEFPLVVNPLSFLLRNQPFIRNYHWQPARGLRFHVFEKDGGRRIATAETDAAFAFHHVNAYEMGNELIVDLVAYPDAEIIEEFYLTKLRAGEPIDGTGRLTRHILSLAADDNVRTETIANAPIELPRINYGRHAGRAYRAVWATGNHRPGNFLDSIVTLDITAGSAREWWEDGTYPGEPVFVARPGSDREDDGVLLSVVLDASRNRSFLVALDAAGLTEIARAECPHHIPFGFHGNYFAKTGQPLSLADIHR